jgi:hypothetical protein
MVKIIPTTKGETQWVDFFATIPASRRSALPMVVVGLEIMSIDIIEIINTVEACEA